MNILIIASEMDGIVKTGGLADFAGALPKALMKRGHEVRVSLPFYMQALGPPPAFPDWGKDATPTADIKSEPLYFNLNHTNRYGCLVHHVDLDGIPVRLVEYNDFFSRSGIYGDDGDSYPDNALRFAFLCKASLEQCISEKWMPDIVHCNDWQTALAPYYLKEHFIYHPGFQRTRSLMTIHNGEYQWKTDRQWCDPLGILPQRFTSELMEEHDRLNLLKCGIMYADAVNTVSPGYCQELLQPETSHGLWLYLNRRIDCFAGILNGCEYDLWNPQTDPFVPHHFSAENISGKALCKAALQMRMRLPENSAVPLLGLISRLTQQKGFDYLIPALERLLYEDAPVQLALLGSGDPDYGSRLHHLQHRYPHKMSFVNGYDNGLSHLIEAGSDFFMMPSLFEPCGLNQLYSLAYGTIPITRETGGLKDTVTGLASNHGNAGQATGIAFTHPDSHGCYGALKRAIALYLEHQSLYRDMQHRAMMQSFTWEESARQYEMLYEAILS